MSGQNEVQCNYFACGKTHNLIVCSRCNKHVCSQHAPNGSYCDRHDATRSAGTFLKFSGSQHLVLFFAILFAAFLQPQSVWAQEQPRVEFQVNWNANFDPGSTRWYMRAKPSMTIYNNVGYGPGVASATEEIVIGDEWVERTYEAEWIFAKQVKSFVIGKKGDDYMFLRSDWYPDVCPKIVFKYQLFDKEVKIFVDNVTDNTVTLLFGDGTSIPLEANKSEVYPVGLEGSIVVNESNSATCGTLFWQEPGKNYATLAVPAWMNEKSDDWSVTHEIPVYLETDVTGLNIESVLFDFKFDPTVIRYMGARPGDVIPDEWGLGVNTEEAANGHIKVLSWGQEFLTGSPTIAYLEFDYVGPAFSSTNLTLENVLFNEGDPGANVRNGTLTLDARKVFGYVSHHVAGNRLGNVTAIATTDVLSRTSTSNNLGYYQVVMPEFDFKLEWQKERVLHDKRIGAWDASLIARFVIDLVDTCPIKACDTTGDGTVTGVDANRVAEYAVGLPVDRVGSWFSEPSEAFFHVVYDTQRDVVMYLNGDASGPEEVVTAASGSMPLAKLSAEDGRVVVQVDMQEVYSAEFVTNLPVSSVTSTCFDSLANDRKVVAYTDYPCDGVELVLEVNGNAEDLKIEEFIINNVVYEGRIQQFNQAIYLPTLSNN